MKKILFMFITFISLTSIAIKVEASEAKCVYYDQVDNDSLYTVEIKNNELSVSTTKKEDELTGRKFFLDEGTLRVSHFINDDKYYCREEIYYQMQERADGTGENIILQPNKGAIGQLVLDKEKSKVSNDETVPNPDIPKDEQVDPDNNEQEEYMGEASGFWGYLDAVKCGDAEIPTPIPPLTRIIVTLIKILAPLVLIIMGMIDIVKAVTASDEKKMKEAQTKFIKRLIPAAAIFLVVTIMQLLVGIVADSSEDSDSLSTCIACMISDGSKCILVKGKVPNTENEQEQSENSSKSEYTSSNSHTSSVTGIKFKLYNQSDSRWGKLKYPKGKTVSDVGCLISSVAVVSSSHDGEITPKTVFNSKYRSSYPYNSVDNLTDSNFSCKKVSYSNKQEYIDSLNAGNVLIIKVEANSKFTNSQHYMALIDISNNGEKIFVGNSYGSGTGKYNKSGWFSTSTVLTDVHEIYSCKPSKKLIDKFN